MSFRNGNANRLAALNAAGFHSRNGSLGDLIEIFGIGRRFIRNSDLLSVFEYSLDLDESLG
jgi:hypothetical protein